MEKKKNLNELMTIEKLKKKKELACRRALLNFFSFLKNMFLHAYSKNIKAFLNSQSFLYRYTLNKL